MAEEFDPDQYIQSFDPDQYLGQREDEATPEQSAPTQGFDPDKYIQSFDPDAYLKGRSPQGEPEAEGHLAADTREVAHSIIPAATGVAAGAGASALTTAGLAALGVASGPVGWAALGAGALGMLGGAYLGSHVDDAVAKTLGVDDAAQRQANLKARPIETRLAGMAPFVGSPVASLGQRAVGAGMMTAFSGGQQLYEGKFDPTALAVDAAFGAAMPNGNAVTRAIHGKVDSAVNSYLPGRPDTQPRPGADAEKANEPDTIGNPQSSPERSERGYAKGAGETPQGDILTTGDVDPATMAALKETEPARAETSMPEVEQRPMPEAAPVEPRPAEMPARAQEGEKVTGEVGEFEPPKEAELGGGDPPQEPPSGGPKEPLKPPPPEVKVTKEDLETGLWPLLTRTFGGRDGPSWLAAQKNILGKHGEAEQVRQTDQARFTNDMHKLMNETSPAEQRMLVNWTQKGNKFPTYKPSEGLKEIIGRIREGYGDFQKMLSGMTDFERMQFIDNDKYLTGQYKNKTPDEAREFFKNFSRQGGSGSTKKRFFPTDEEARDAGFEPVSTNPIERYLLYSEAMSNHIAYKKILREGMDSGYIKYYNPHTVAGAGTPEPYVKGKPPEGWAPIDGLKNAGGAQAYAPRDYAAAMNNFHGNGLGGRSSEWRDFFSGIRRVSNNFTALELGIATYHAFTTIHERTASAWSTALSQAASGDMAAAGKTFAKSLVAPFDIKTGKRFQDLYNGTVKDGTPQEMAIVDAAKAANIKPISAKHAMDYEMSKAGSYATAYVRGSLKHELAVEWKNIIGENGWKEGMLVLPRNLGRMMQTIAHPLFQAYIPRMKSAAFFENVKAWMDANPDAKVEDLHAVAIKIGKSIDNRMGEMAQDNMLMNRTLRDAGTLLLRSFSFTLGGPFREIGGGTQSLARGAAKGEFRLSIKSNQYDPRTAYALAFPLAVASMSMLYQFIKTGKGPEEWRDLVYPKTGGEQPGVGKGHLVPERALLPGYHKDIMAYLAHPGREATNKIAGLWQAIGDQIAGTKMTEVGRVPLVPPNASVGEAALARGKAFGEKALPIFVKTVTQDPRLTSKISFPEQVVGFRSPGKWAADPVGQHIADDKRAQREWDFAQKRINTDRATRGLPPLPPRERNPNP